MVLGALLGTLTGVLTGLTPGIHVNTVTALLLAGSASLASFGVEYSALLAFTCCLAISHTFFDVVPGLFLGVPGDETFALLPGHRLVRKGEGRSAVELSVAGSAVGLAFGTAVLAGLLLLGNVLGAAERLLNPWMFWVLLAVSAVLVVTDRRRIWSLVAFLASGLLGLAVLASPLVAGGSDAPVNALFPSLAGLFGVAGLLFAIGTDSGPAAPVPQSATSRLRLSPVARPGLKGGFAGLVVGLLPGIGAANAATLLHMLERGRGRGDQDEEDRSYLVTTSSLNTSEALFAIAALLLIGRSRSGASIAVEQILGGIIDRADVWLIAAIMVGGGVMAAAILWRLGKRLAEWFGKVDSASLNSGVIAFLAVMTFLLLGAGGLAILVSATAVGLVPLLFGVRRAQLMGFFLVPTMLYFSGHQGRVVDLLSLATRTSALQPSLTAAGVLLAVAGSTAIGALTYFVARNSPLRARGSASKRSLSAPACVLAAAAVLGLALTGRAYPPSPEAALAPEPAAEVEGRIIQTIDADTFEIAALCRRFRVRLKGVDAPELGTAAGDRARDWAASAFAGEGVTLRPVGVDTYGRILGHLYLRNGTYVNDEIIRRGHASPYAAGGARRRESPARPGEDPRPSMPEGPDRVAEPIPWDDDGNGRVTCAEARRHGIAPVKRGHPAYPHMRDGDGDGTVCE